MARDNEVSAHVCTVRNITDGDVERLGDAQPGVLRHEKQNKISTGKLIPRERDGSNFFGRESGLARHAAER